jgi:hypothetical protein
LCGLGKDNSGRSRRRKDAPVKGTDLLASHEDGLDSNPNTNERHSVQYGIQIR